jgi:phosphoglycolate phosphatase
MGVDKEVPSFLFQCVETSTEQPFRTVLFDLDGTLVDQFRVIYEAYAHAMAELELPPVTYEQVRGAVGGSIVITFGKLVPAEYVDKAVAIFREEFNRIWDRQIDVLPGVVDTLKALKAQGCQLAVFTNKDGDVARKVVAKAGLSEWVDGVFGTLDTPWRKPDAEFTHHVMRSLNADCAHTCMIGDSPYDAAAAANGGIPCYTVATGSHSVEQLREECPDAPAYPDMSTLAADVFDLKPQTLIP